MVFVECMTFNHHAYIEDAMNGFCMQETNFPFVCVIVDDASTDGEPEVIKRYFDDHFDLSESSETDDYVMTFGQHKTNKNCYFVILYLKYNHYSIKKDKTPYYARWRDNSKYIALCEGDDYWIAKDKLQMQVDFLEKNEEYYACCHQSLAIRPNKETLSFMWNENMSNDHDIIKLGGYINFPATASYFFKNPNSSQNQSEKSIKNYAMTTGWDKSLVLFFFSMGKVRYFSQLMSCYRVNSGGNIMALRWKNNMTETLEKNEQDMLRQVKEYGLKEDIRPHYYRNALFYSIRFWWNDKTKENFKWIKYVLKRTPNKILGFIYICKLTAASIYHWIKDTK